VTASTVAVTVLWIAVLTRFPSQRKAPIRGAVWLTMLLLAAIGTLDLTAIAARLDAACGLPNIADLAQHVLAIIAATLARETRPENGDRHAYRAFMAGTDLDSEVRLLRVVAAQWPTIRVAAETIERGSAAGGRVGEGGARPPIEPNRPPKTGIRSLTPGPGAVRGCAPGSAARVAGPEAERTTGADHDL